MSQYRESCFVYNLSFIVYYKAFKRFKYPSLNKPSPPSPSSNLHKSSFISFPKFVYNYDVEKVSAF